jgi:TetR/AcrR family transcriptional repressor of nem operon
MTTTTTSTQNDTKERILDAAEAIVLEKGFSGVGINEILKAVNVPKGSFYHWFASKEQFGVDLINHYAADALAHKKKWLSKKDSLPDARERLIAYFEATQSTVLEHDCRQVCLIGKLSAEVSSWSDPMRTTLGHFYDQVTALYETVVKEGQAQGSITKKYPARFVAALLQDTWSGAYMRASIIRSAHPLRDAIAFAKSFLLP